MEIPNASDFILQEAHVVVLYVLWQVAEENKLRRRTLQLCYVLDFQVPSTRSNLRRLTVDDFQHGVIQFAH